MEMKLNCMRKKRNREKDSKKDSKKRRKKGKIEINKYRKIEMNK